MGRTELPGRCFLAAKSQWHRFLVIHGKPPALPISSPWVQSGTRSVAHSKLSDRADAQSHTRGWAHSERRRRRRTGGARSEIV